MRLHVYAVFALIAASVLVSYSIHSPDTGVPFGNFGFKYSDIVHGLFYTRFKAGSHWFEKGKFEALEGGRRLCPIPYVDYHFEYPPIIGLLWFASTCISFMITMPEAYSPGDYGELLGKAASIHYNLQALFLAAALLLLAASTYGILKFWGLNYSRLALLALSPSLIIYLTYNWDVLAASLFTLGFYSYIRGRYRAAGALIGLSVSVKLLTALAGLALLLRLAGEGDKRGVKEYLKYFTLASIIPYALLAILSPHGFRELLSHHSSWYCENCLYLLLTRDIWSAHNRVIAALSVGVAAGMIIVASIARAGDVRRLALASIMAPIVLNYVFSPQMILMVTPIALVTLTPGWLPAYVLADALNAAIIIVFFGDSNPWTLEGVTQKIALLRNIILLAILANLILSLTLGLARNKGS
ncbi:MAG: hypothetical protein P3X22_003340 [Thermoprotei archaeon]|nr:hypothetical protein [Thermoprotei archaeon]